MRRVLSLVLLLVFGLPVVAPAFGSEANAQTNLPACCRRDGAHHCTKTPEQLEALRHGNQFNAVGSKCPYCPSTPVSAHFELFTVQATHATSLNPDTHPASFRQAEAWARVALAGARQKRGPPSVRLS
jgi:hypothetical protein